MNKIIHYIWLGHAGKSRTIKRCIKSWAEFFPDWEIREWNESNLDLQCNSYVREAYNAGKYAFASDYFRFDILYKYGGLYFDVDVMVLQSFDQLIAGYDAFAGFENQYVAPGLVLYSKEPGNVIMKEMCDVYGKGSFILPDGGFNQKTVGQYFTEILIRRGLVQNNELQQVDGLTIFPNEYFNPMNYYGEMSDRTANSYSVHLYMASWLPKGQQVKNRVRNFLHRVISGV